MSSQQSSTARRQHRTLKIVNSQPSLPSSAAYRTPAMHEYASGDKKFKAPSNFTPEWKQKSEAAVHQTNRLHGKGGQVDFSTPTFQASASAVRVIEESKSFRGNRTNMFNVTGPQNYAQYAGHGKTSLNCGIVKLQKMQPVHQNKRDQIKLKPVSVPKRGMLQLDAVVEKPRSNHMPYTTKPGDISAIWGNNKVPSLLNQNINIFTPNVANSHYLSVADDSHQQRMMHSNSVNTLRARQLESQSQIRDTDNFRRSSQLEDGESTNNMRNGANTNRELFGQKTGSFTIKSMQSNLSPSKTVINDSNMLLAKSVEQSLLAPVMSKIASVQITPRYAREFAIRRSSSLDEQIKKIDFIPQNQRSLQLQHKQMQSDQQQTAIGEAGANLNKNNQKSNERDLLQEEDDEYFVDKGTSNRQKSASEFNSPSNNSQYLGRPKLNQDTHCQSLSRLVTSNQSKPLHSILANHQRKTTTVTANTYVPYSHVQAQHHHHQSQSGHALTTNLQKNGFNLSTLGPQTYQTARFPPTQANPLTANLLEKSILQASQKPLRKDTVTGAAIKLAQSEQQLPSLANNFISPQKFKSRQELQGLLPAPIMTPGQIMLMGSQGSGGGSSALFYGKGLQQQNYNLKSGSMGYPTPTLGPPVLISNTKNTEENDATLHRISPSQFKSPNFASGQQELVKHQNEQKAQISKQSGTDNMLTSPMTIGNIDMVGVAGESKYFSVQALFNDLDHPEGGPKNNEAVNEYDTKAETRRKSHSIKKNAKLSHNRKGHQNSRKMTQRVSGKESICTNKSRGESHVFLGTEVSNNPVSINNLIKNRSKKSTVTHSSGREPSAIGGNQVTIIHIAGNKQTTATQSKCPSTQALNSVENRLRENNAGNNQNEQLPIYTDRNTKNQQLTQGHYFSNNMQFISNESQDHGNNKSSSLIHSNAIVEHHENTVLAETERLQQASKMTKQIGGVSSICNSSIDNLSDNMIRCKTTAVETMRQTCLSSAMPSPSPDHNPSHDNRDINILDNKFNEDNLVIDSANEQNANMGNSKERLYSFMNEFLGQQQPEQDHRPHLLQVPGSIQQQSSTGSPAKITLTSDARNMSPEQKQESIEGTPTNLRLKVNQSVQNGPKEDPKFENARPRNIMLEQIKKHMASAGSNEPGIQIYQPGINSSRVKRVQNQTQIKLQKRLEFGLQTRSHRHLKTLGLAESPSIPRHKNLLSKRPDKNSQWLAKSNHDQEKGLQESFFESLDEVTMQRELKIKTEKVRENKRIQLYTSTLQPSEIKSSRYEVTATPQIKIDGLEESSPRKMNEFIHKQMLMNPKSGRLSRQDSKPYNNVKFKPIISGSHTRVKKSTLTNMRSNIESSIGINNNQSNSSPSVHEDLALKNKKHSGTPNKNIEQSGTTNQSWSTRPVVRPLNLREITNSEIKDMLVREQFSCQHFSLVDTPRALKHGAKFNIDREEKAVKKKQDDQNQFDKQRKEVRDEKHALMNDLKQEYCIDFEAEKLKQRKERTRQNLKRFAKNFLEHYEILVHKMGVNPMLLQKYKLFPSQPFDRGDVRTFLKHVKQGSLESVYRMLQSDPLLVFQFDELQQNGLIWAAKRNHTLMVRMLCKAHSRINYRDLPGRTALHFAVMNDNEEMVKILLCFKADPNIEDNQGVSSMQLYNSMGKKCNLKIGAHMKHCSQQLFRMKFLIDFIYQAQIATIRRKSDKKKALQDRQTPELTDVQNANDEGNVLQAKNTTAQPIWTRRELRDREWKKDVLDVLDRYKTIEESECGYFI